MDVNSKISIENVKDLVVSLNSINKTIGLVDKINGIKFSFLTGDRQDSNGTQFAECNIYKDRTHGCVDGRPHLLGPN